MWSSLPIVHILRKRLTRAEPGSLESAALRSWEIAPAEVAITKPAYFLPNQLERVTGWAFANEHPRREMEGGIETVHGPTRGFLLEDAWLIDGVLYKDQACSHLQPRSRRVPKLRVEVELDRGAVYCTAGGNKWFGDFLMVDCVTYPLASAEGVPVTTDHPAWAHVPGYESWLDMRPLRLGGAHFRELVIFNDRGQNRGKHERYCAIREKLISRVDAKPHPGVFILRGRSGELRLLRNELELAERLRERRGFRILDPMTADVPTIVATCAGAQTVVGLEGSGLMHGIIVLSEGGAVLTLQMPNRFVRVYKYQTDREGQHYGFVVAHAVEDVFVIDPEEVERTLDLFPA